MHKGDKVSRRIIQLNSAINFAHANWSGDIDLNSLANSAHMSKFHFSKLFHGYTGEAPISFLNRIRLENAAAMLCYSQDKLINDIAIESGFSSNQTFTRAFGNHYGKCPRSFRSNFTGNLAEALDENKSNQYVSSTCFNENGQNRGAIEDRVKLIQRKPVKVAYIRNIGSYGFSHGIDSAVDRIKHWAKKQGLWCAQSKIIGVSWDSNEITPNTLCKYDACIEIPGDFRLDREISVQTLPGGLYARYRALCLSNGEISLLWREFLKYLRLSPRYSNLRPGPKPNFEVFESSSICGVPQIELFVRMVKPYWRTAENVPDPR